MGILRVSETPHRPLTQGENPTPLVTNRGHQELWWWTESDTFLQLSYILKNKHSLNVLLLALLFILYPKFVHRCVLGVQKCKMLICTSVQHAPWQCFCFLIFSLQRWSKKMLPFGAAQILLWHLLTRLLTGALEFRRTFHSNNFLFFFHSFFIFHSVFHWVHAPDDDPLVYPVDHGSHCTLQ